MVRAERADVDFGDLQAWEREGKVQLCKSRKTVVAAGRIGKGGWKWSVEKVFASFCVLGPVRSRFAPLIFENRVRQCRSKSHLFIAL